MSAYCFSEAVPFARQTSGPMSQSVLSLFSSLVSLYSSPFLSGLIYNMPRLSSFNALFLFALFSRQTLGHGSVVCTDWDGKNDCDKKTDWPSHPAYGKLGKDFNYK